MTLPPKRILGIIPARAGSKGLPGKNLLEVGGESLVKRAIDGARASERLTDIFVTTDDPAVKAVAEAEGVGVLKRPPELAGDSTSLVPVVLDLLDTLGGVEDTDVVVLLQPTSPLRRGDHIDQALSRVLEGGFDGVVSVTSVEHSPFKMLTLDGDHLAPLFDRESLHKSRQDLPSVFRQNGVVYAIRVGAFRREKTFCPLSCGAFEMSAEESVDIDVEGDVEVAEEVFRRVGRGD